MKAIISAFFEGVAVFAIFAPAMVCCGIAGCVAMAVDAIAERKDHA